MLLTKDRTTDLRLPEFDIKLPDIDVSDLKMPDIDLPKVDLGQATSDLGKAISSAVASSPLRRRSSRSRWPLAVVGGLIAGAAAWAIVSNEALRGRITDSVMVIRRRFDVLLTGTGSKPIDPVAFDATPTAPIEADMPTTDPLYAGLSDYPEGLGSKGAPHGNGEAVKIR